MAEPPRKQAAPELTPRQRGQRGRRQRQAQQKAAADPQAQDLEAIRRRNEELERLLAERSASETETAC